MESTPKLGSWMAQEMAKKKALPSLQDEVVDEDSARRLPRYGTS
eukprot:CAMPEP_0169206878 /NCGR_PEP_ID=MMETSP1016-20121227/13281_1 /TAXON_ID=342587 /ORGANISM="Karlodinium micrum, Strain CCMP2283" /LENGTH=43 /DNA_ID= /DNA_START= /DNA_END= /DNA_ORIENTATION=